MPGGYQEGFLEGAALGLGKREGLYIHFLFLPQRNRRWPRGLEGDFRASVREDVMACRLTAPDLPLLLAVCRGLPEHLQLLVDQALMFLSKHPQPRLTTVSRFLFWARGLPFPRAHTHFLALLVLFSLGVAQSSG